MINPRIKRRYNLVYNARKNGYTIVTRERMIYLPVNAGDRNPSIEKNWPLLASTCN